jgi:hypothetical protein
MQINLHTSLSLIPLFTPFFYRFKAKLEVSTEQLQNMMKNLEEQADFLTALALFSIKTVDKKVAFIVGLVKNILNPAFCCIFDAFICDLY